MTSLAGQSDVERVRDATDLVALIGEHVALRPKGREHVGLCPFHDDHKPSFAVVTHKEHAFYKCHACGAGGDAFDFVKTYHRMDFPEALRYLAERAGLLLTPRRSGSTEQGTESEGPTRADLRDANALAAEFFRRVLKSETAGKVGRSIIEERGVSAEMAEQFMMGLAPDQWDGLLNLIRKRKLSESTFAAAGLIKQRTGGGSYDAFRNRLIFPICNEIGQPIAFGARKINPEDEPKYLNSAESAIFQKSRTLYGLHLAKRAIIDSRQAVITEGYTDVIACHQRGLCNVVGTLGTALTKEHAAVLSRLCESVVLLFDGDEAGMRAADRGIEVFFAEPVDVRICAIPGGLDPDDLLRQDGETDRLGELIASAEDALAYKVRRFRETLDHAAGLSGRQKLLEAFLGDLAQLGFSTMQGVRKRFVLAQLSDLLAIPVTEIERAMPRPRAPLPALRASQMKDHSGSTANSEQRTANSDVHVPAARRRAEHELLAILLFDASLASEPVEVEDGKALRLTEAVLTSDILDPSSRLIAECVFLWLASGEPFTMQRLLGELASSDAKKLASSLYFDGERRCAEAPSALDELRHAALALLAHIEREAHRHRVAQFHHTCRNEPAALRENGADLRELIEQRRKLLQKQGTIAAAIGRGVRS